MFELLHRESAGDVPEGMIDATSLMVELIAGGVTNTHVQMVSVTCTRVGRHNGGVNSRRCHQHTCTNGKCYMF